MLSFLRYRRGLHRAGNLIAVEDQLFEGVFALLAGEFVQGHRVLQNNPQESLRSSWGLGAMPTALGGHGGTPPDSIMPTQSGGHGTRNEHDFFCQPTYVRLRL